MNKNLNRLIALKAAIAIGTLGVLIIDEHFYKSAGQIAFVVGYATIHLALYPAYRGRNWTRWIYLGGWGLLNFSLNAAILFYAWESPSARSEPWFFATMLDFPTGVVLAYCLLRNRVGAEFNQKSFALWRNLYVAGLLYVLIVASNVREAVYTRKVYEHWEILDQAARALSEDTNPVAYSKWEDKLTESYGRPYLDFFRNATRVDEPSIYWPAVAVILAYEKPKTQMVEEIEALFARGTSSPLVCPILFSTNLDRATTQKLLNVIRHHGNVHRLPVCLLAMGERLELKTNAIAILNKGLLTNSFSDFKDSLNSLTYLSRHWSVQDLSTSLAIVVDVLTQDKFPGFQPTILGSLVSADKKVKSLREAIANEIKHRLFLEKDPHALATLEKVARSLATEETRQHRPGSKQQ